MNTSSLSMTTAQTPLDVAESPGTNQGKCCLSKECLCQTTISIVINELSSTV